MGVSRTVSEIPADWIMSQPYVHQLLFLVDLIPRFMYLSKIFSVTLILESRRSARGMDAGGIGT